MYSLVRRSSTTYRRDDRGGSCAILHPSISLSAAEQESHTVGKPGSLPTQVEYFQQRSHLRPSARSTRTPSRGFQDHLRNHEQRFEFVLRSASASRRSGIRTRASSGAPIYLVLRASSSAFKHRLARFHERVPIGELGGVPAGGDFLRLRKQRQMDAVGRARGLGRETPGFLRRERQQRRDQPDQSVVDPIQRRLSAAARAAARRRWYRAGPWRRRNRRALRSVVAKS